jgi:signal transduction histidine kinase
MSRGARFHLDVTTARLKDTQVSVSAEYLEQQLLILLDNAFKYTPEGGHVHLSAAATEDTVRLTVTDTGPGIGDQDLPRIFDRFYRGHNVNGTTGTGLGLAIAQWIAQQHHGSIEVESHPGRGSRFTIVVPRIPPSPGGRHARARASRSTRPAPVSS